mmetsp:Transcript_34488/g.50394  ORF Transcript_34488/g.50394 Transcript_34488/m.50394 type:complete len:82 (-) Transcript_34488:187-432(-)
MVECHNVNWVASLGRVARIVGEGRQNPFLDVLDFLAVFFFWLATPLFFSGQLPCFFEFSLLVLESIEETVVGLQDDLRQFV